MAEVTDINDVISYQSDRRQQMHACTDALCMLIPVAR